MDKDDKMNPEEDLEYGGQQPWNIQPSKSIGRSSRRGSLSRSRSLAREMLASGSIGTAAPQSYGLFGAAGNLLDAASRSSTREEDENELRWAALEKLPTYKRIRTSILQQHTGSLRELDVKKLSVADFQHLLQTLHRPTDNDDEQILAKLRKRLDRVGIELPTIEVRFENLTVEANCHVGSRGLPTLWNVFLNILESVAGFLHLSPTRKQVVTILDNVSGLIKPGRMTLLLGPPGSGKTTLLLALAAKLDPDLKVKGKVMFNGHTFDEFVVPKTAAYVSQHDLHVGELTVRETFQFSSKVQGVGHQYEILEEVAKREKESGIRPDLDVDTYMKATAMPGNKAMLAVEHIIRMLGLEICADTVVGNEMLRGISGGQKKRVTTGEMLVGPLKTLFMDEISTGLDSSTTFSIVRSLGRFTHELSATTLISLLQPAPETFNLFDDVILLSEGQVVYHGPIANVVEFFELCGFKCPERKGIADFLQEVTSRKDQEQYWADKRKPYRYVPVKCFADEFQRFHVWLRMKDELGVAYHKERSHPAALAKETYSISNKELFWATFDRELTLLKRNGIVYIIKAIQITMSAFISMTTFFRTRLHTQTVNDGGLYFNALFYAIIMFMFTGFGELASTITRLPVLIKQRDMLFIPAWAFSLSTMLLSIPGSILEVGIFTCMSYFVTGFAPNAGAFFKFALILFLIQQQAGGMFRFIGAVCRTMTLGFTLGWIILLLLFMLGGFIIPRPDIPVWWRWGFWISNMSYAVQGDRKSVV